MRKIEKLFKCGNVCVTGLRGTGKDMLMANVIARRKEPYISNMDYKNKGCARIPLDFNKLDTLNNYDNLVSGEIVPYEYPYPENVDIYVSDCGVYFPSQDNKELNKKYERFPMFQALSRQLGQCNFHINAQNLNRVWDKIREQSDIYVRCVSCKVIGRFVFQRVVVYDKCQSCIDRVEPFKRLPCPIFAPKEQKALIRAKNAELKQSYRENKGLVRGYLLCYVNRSNYDTRLFKQILRGKNA